MAKKTLGGSDTDIASSIIQTTDGGYVVAGKVDNIKAATLRLNVLKDE